MKNEKLFNETIDKLVKAYFEGTLRHRNCSACAVGNILGTNTWREYFFTDSDVTPDRVNQIYYEVIRVVKGRPQLRPIEPPAHPFPSSEYTMNELMDIEAAFETAPKEGDWEFNGLMAVVDVLEKIHECDAETTKATKQRFHKNRNFSQSFCQ